MPVRAREDGDAAARQRLEGRFSQAQRRHRATPGSAASWRTVGTPPAARAPRTRHGAALVVAGAGWAVAFGLFVLAYRPRLCAARLDGKPG
ncbi:hypothetical protein [Massilia sp. METH4]|uniref:hypothetical protein n=1 Tax=Massilia sp. METH4 TaxID=3123041 RepID=UPI0030D41140